MGRGLLLGRCAVVALALGLMPLAGCGATAPPRPSPTSRPSRPTPTPTPAPTTVTVIAPLGVNLRSSPSTSASIVTVLSQGVTLPIVSHTSADGGWWEVKASSGEGWVSADPVFTSTETFETFAVPGATAWSVMYPQGWTFAQQSNSAIQFTGPPGSSITFDSAAVVSQLPAQAPSGATQSGVTSAVVYGITAPLVTYLDPGHYEASVELQAESGLALLIQCQLPAATGSATFQLFLDTVYVPGGT